MGDTLEIWMQTRDADCGLCGAPTPFCWGVPTYNGDVVSNEFPDSMSGGSFAVCRECYEAHAAGRLPTFDHYYLWPGPLGVVLLGGAGI